MDHGLIADVAEKYKSPTQRIRVLTESWVAKNSFCPNCGNSEIYKYPNNQPVADFFCDSCGEDYELKSKAGEYGGSIVDGAYATMMSRLRSARNPNFFLLGYEAQQLRVQNYFVIPKHFFVPDLIRKRRPLAATARRAGWVGCNIIIRNVPAAGKVYIVKNGRDLPIKDVLQQWKRSLFLRDAAVSERGWTIDVMRCVDALRKKSFSLDDVYEFEQQLADLHPENKHVKDKIRQQLQILRDRGYLIFERRGRYRLRG